jgi:hypothetical protein
MGKKISAYSKKCSGIIADAEQKDNMIRDLQEKLMKQRQTNEMLRKQLLKESY